MKETVGNIAVMLNGVVSGDPWKMITGVAPFEQAGPEDITFAEKADFLNHIHQTMAGAVIVPVDWVPVDWVPADGKPTGEGGASRSLVAVANPRAAFAGLIKHFSSAKAPRPGISPNAWIGNHFTCGEAVSIYPGVIVADRVSLGNRVVLHPGVVLEDDVRVGSDVEIHANVSVLQGCVIGNRVIINAGTVIGSDGFGFSPEADRHVKITHTGRVQIDDDVEIGANNTIDRGTFGKTWIKQGVKTDNLVHIAHNVVIGENTLIVAQVGIAGSVRIGKSVVLAGQAGISQHLEIGDGAVVGPQAGITKSVAGGEVVSGTPGMPHKRWLKTQSIVTRLPEIKKSLKTIEKRLSALETAGEASRHEAHGNG